MENKTLFTIYNEKEVEISISEIFDHKTKQPNFVNRKVFIFT